MAFIHDDRTPNDDLALPHPDNDQEDDVLRLRDALIAVDAALHAIRQALASGLDGTAQELDNRLLSITNVIDSLAQHVENTKVSKTGALMTGPLSVPSGASGEQVPQAQEVVLRAGAQSVAGIKTFSSAPVLSSGAKFATGTAWEIVQSGSDLLFKHNGTNRFKITSAGALVASSDITGGGAP